MKKLLNLDYNAYSLPVIAAYMSIAFIFADFGVSAVLGGAFLCAWTLICALSFVFVKKFKFRDFKLVHWLILAFLCIVAINMLRNLELDRDLIYYAMIMFAGCVLFITASPVSQKVLNLTKNILIGVATLFSSVNILHFYFPESVRQVLFKVLTQHSIHYNNRMFREGYGYAFGSSIGLTACLIALGLMIVWFDFTPKKWKTHIPLLILLSLGLTIVQRRGELLIFIIAIIIVTIINFFKSKAINISTKEQLKIITVLILCVAIGLGIYYISAENSRFDVSDFVDDSETELEPEVNLDALSTGRFTLWNLAWEGFLDNPILGKGWRAFAKIGPVFTGDNRALNSHNVYLQLLCETGVVGFLLIGAVFITILVLIIKKMLKAQNVSNIKKYAIALCALLAMLGFGVIDNSLYINHWIQIFQMVLFISFASNDDCGNKSLEN